jgi:hypothetical protein
VVSDAAEFIDAALQYEVSPYVYPVDEPDGLTLYGTSMGAIRGTVRDALKRYPEMTHDEITALSSELWSVPVFERRQAAIVLLQTHVGALVTNDLTRIEGFLRSAGSPRLVEQLTVDVLLPMFDGMAGTTLQRVRPVLSRWVADPDAKLHATGLRLRDASDAAHDRAPYTGDTNQRRV